MKRLLAGVALVGILALLWNAARHRSTAQRPAAHGQENAKASVAAAPVVNSGDKALTQAEQARAGSPLADELLRREGTPEQDLEIVRQLIGQYFSALQNQSGPPIGDNADLVRALTGQNPLKLVVIPPGHPVLGADGQLRDRWGTPYHLHRLSSQHFEIRSAGPDGRLFTQDDQIRP